MQPELLTKHFLTILFVVALILCLLTLVLALANARIANQRISLAHPERGTAQFIIAAQIKRTTISGVIIALAIGAFTLQALSATRAGTFALTADWFSLSFISLIYLPLILRLGVIILEFRDRHYLAEIG